MAYNYMIFRNNSQYQQSLKKRNPANRTSEVLLSHNNNNM